MTDAIKRDTRSHKSSHAIKDECSFARLLKSRYSKRGLLIVSLYGQRELKHMATKIVRYRIATQRHGNEVERHCECP